MNWRIGCLVALATSACQEPPRKPPTGPRPVRAVAVSEAVLGGAAQFSATIQAKDASQLSFRVGGTVTKVGVKRGDTVKKGQLLARLDERDLKVQLSQAQANASSARAQRDLAKRTLQRTEKMFESGAATRSAYDNAKGQLSAAQAQLSAAGQAARQARNSLQYGKLIAPFAGVVNMAKVKVGESVQPGAPVFVISKGGALEVQLGVPENVVSQLKAGRAATVVVPALDKSDRPGKITEVGFAPEGNTYPVAIALDTPDAALRPGMVATVRFELGERKSTLTLPSNAVGNDAKTHFVYALVKAGDAYTVKRKAVELGPLKGDRFPVVKGVAAGELVATAGLSRLVDGMTVRLLPAEAKR
jgi:RND family efflux transporter MFP subunit